MDEQEKSVDRCNENVIEFLYGQETATVTFSQIRFKNRIRELAEKYPEECRIVAENKDGSICAQIPTRWVKISPPIQRIWTEEERMKARERLAYAREISNKNKGKRDLDG